MPEVDLQTYISTLPPKEREAILKLPEAQQISIMNESLKTGGKNTSDPMFDFEQNDNNIGLKLEKTPTIVQQPENKDQQFTRYVIQNNTGLYHYANLQGEARKLREEEYKKVDLKTEIKVIKQNNPEIDVNNLRAGGTLLLEGEIDTSNMDSIEETMNKYINGQDYLEKQKQAKKAEFERQQKLTGDALKQSVIDGMKNSYSTAQKLFDNQMKKDGWAADVADGVSALWNNGWWNLTGNRAKFVREDLKQYNENTAALEKAFKEGNYNEKFKEIYGVEYSEQNIKDFNEKEAKLKEVSTALAVNTMLEKHFSSPLKKYNENFGIFKDHEEVLNSPTGTFKKKTPANYLLKDVESKLYLLIGKSNVESVAKKSNVDLSTESDENKYKFYMTFVENMVNSTKKDLENKLNGRKAQDYLADFEKASKNAFGSENNIQERVIKYNGSQEAGAAAIKSVAKSAVIAGSAIVITASGGTATPLVMGGLTFGAGIGVEVSDKLSNDIDGDLDKEAVGKIVKNSFIDGTAAYGGTHLANGLRNLRHFKGKHVQQAWSMATDGASGTIEGTITDLLKDGIDNVTSQTIAARALISSTIGNIKAFTANRAVLNSAKFAKSGITKGTLEEIKLEIKKQAEKDKAIKELFDWLEKNPVEFEKIIINELEKIE